MNLMFRIFGVLTAFTFTVSESTAQTQAPASGEMDMDLYMDILLALLFIMINAIFIPLLRSPEIPLAEGEVAEKKETALQVITKKLSGLQPMEKEHTLLLEGNYDGIEELDNDVPPWFNILFYGTVIIGIIYFLNFHVLKTGKLPLQEYSDEIYAANLQREELIRTGAFINETTVEELTVTEELEAGKKIYVINCVTCHGDGGQGTIGPNLTDEYWIHGGGIKNVFKTIKYGVPAKGMITWMTQLNPKQMQQVASYVMTLHGTNPPGGKAPEGELYKDAVSDSLSAKQDSVKISIDSTKIDSLKKETVKKDTSKVSR